MSARSITSIRSLPRLWALATLSVAAASALTASSAAAASLEPLGCISEAEAVVEGCSAALGLDNAGYLAISPDGRHVYAPGRDSDTITSFKRNRTTAALTQLPGASGCMSNAAAPVPGCASAAGLDRPSGIAISPDGRDVYVTGSNSDSIVALRRDPASGALTPAGCFSNEAAPAPECAPAFGLNDPIGVAVSPDGAQVYVASTASDSISWFTRDPAGGTLTPAGCVSNAQLEGCATVAPGIDDAAWLAISPDGANVYVASRASNAIASFTRDPATGNLTSLGCISGDDGVGQDADCAAGHEIDYAQFVAVAPDGKHVYVSSTDLHALIVLARDPVTGALTQVGCMSDLDNAPGECDQPAVGFSLPLGIAFTPDSRFVYTAAFGYGSIASFERDPSTGMLRQFGPCWAPNDPRCEEVSHLNRSGFLALSPDSRHLYVNSPASDTISFFSRTTSSTGPKVTTREAPIRNGGVKIRLACPGSADGGCIGNVKLSSRDVDVDVEFKQPRYDLLAGQAKKVLVKLKPGQRSELKGVKRFKALVIAVGREPGDLAESGSREITITP